MAWSPPAWQRRNRLGLTPGDYATFNSYQPRYATGLLGLIHSSTHPLDKVTQRTGHRPRHRLIQRKNSAMKTLNVACIGIAGIAGVIAVAAHGQNTAASNNEPEAKTVVDAHGNLHVPDAYRTTYQALGSWAVAADRGKGSKELHVVYASPTTMAAYRESGHFPDGAVLVKEVFAAATGKMATGTVSRAEKLKGGFVMMKDRAATPATSYGATAGAGRGLMLPTRQRQRRPITKLTVNRATFRHELPIGFMSG